VPEETVEDGVDSVGRAQHLLEPGASPPEPQNHQVSDRGLAGALAVDDDRRAALEEGIADEELPAAGKLGDEECLGRRR
jgi:hypothetical protein